MQLELELKRFKKLKRISKGSFSLIYQIEEKKTGNLYAAKVFDCDDDKDKCNEMVNREVNYLIHTKHPTIIKFIGYSKLDFNNENNVTIIMELANNGSLREALRKIQQNEIPKNYTNTTRQIILVGVARGMKYLHDQNIIHRDIKPENILLDENLQPHITDFFLSKFYETGHLRSQTKLGSILAYEAPEILNEQECDLKVDVYSFSILMFEILTDSVLYPELLNGEMTESEFIAKVAKQGYRPKFSVPVKDSLKKLIEQCWSENPSDRPTFDEIFNKLANIKSGEEGDEEENFLLEEVDTEKLNLYVKNITEITDNTEKLLSQTSSLEEDINQLKSENSKLKAENKKQSDTIEKLEEENNQIKSEIEKLKTENNKQPDAIETPEEDINQLKSENSKLKTENKNQSDTIETLEEENNQLKSEIEKLKTENKKQPDATETLEEDNRQLESENSKQKTENEKQSDTIETLEEENNQLKNEIEKLKTENKKQPDTTETLEEDNRQLKNTIESLEEDNDQLKSEIKKLKKSNKKQSDTVEELEEEIQQLKSEIKKLKTENKKQSDAIKEKEKGKSKIDQKQLKKETEESEPKSKPKQTKTKEKQHETSKVKIIVGGYNGFNQLGNKSNNKNKQGSPVIFPSLNLPLDSSSLLSYSVYGYHSVLVTKDGSLIGIGNNWDGQITSCLTKTKITQFTEFAIKDDNGRQLHPISAVCCNNGTLYMFSKSKGHSKQLVYCNCDIKGGSPIFLDIGDEEPVSLFGGFYHAAAINDNGEVIFINRDAIIDSPDSQIEAVSLPDDEKASSVACLFDSVIVLSSNGRVFSSSIDSDNNVVKFKPVSELEDYEIVWLSGTCGHCLAVSNEGNVFGFGSNEFGQLGLDEETESVSSFTEISSLLDYEIRAAYAGSSHSLFETQEGQILSCGSNDYGELLLKSGPSEENVYSPRETTITGGATFCIAGVGISSVFVGGDPPQNTPNM